jgi:energy-coupling factor transport system ATP-binding protein
VESIVEIQNLTYTYRQTPHAPALRDVSLQIRRGEFLAIAGRTGAGKSTLCYALNGLEPHSFGGAMSGRVLVGGHDTRAASVAQLAHTVGIVLQSAESQLIGLTVEEDVQYGLENLALPVREIEERAAWALACVRLSGFAQDSPWTLSGGQRQRLAIASALALQPQVLVLDNSTAELDPIGKAEVLATIGRLNRELDLTVVMVSQDLQEMIPYADRLAILNAGQVVLLGTPAEVLEQAEQLHELGIKLPEPTALSCRLRALGLWDGPLAITPAQCVSRLLPLCRPSRGAPPPPAASAAATEQPPVIQIEQLAFHYPAGQPVLVGVNATIRAGEIVAIMGPNGAGKTTLAKHLNGLLKPTSGRVLVNGSDTRQHSVAQLAKQVGYVFQNPDHQIFARTVGEELSFGPRNLGWPEAAIDSAVTRILADIELSQARQREPFFMGLAERKLIALSSILIMGPKVLVLDEPATGADHGVALRIMRYLSQLRRQGLTVIIITHDTAIAANYADRVLIMREGRIVLDGPPRAVFAQPEELRRAFVAPPQVVDMSRDLRAAGCACDAVTVDQLIESLCAAIAARPAKGHDHGINSPVVLSG